MNNKKNFKNAFTLIELLAVIIILGILMIIAIPSVTSYINNSRKSAYVDTAKELVSGARTFVNEGKVPMYDTSTTYYVDYGCVKTENASKSPYGDFVNAYVVVTYDGKGYTYYWTSVDTAGQGVKIITKADELDEDDIVSDISAAEVAANVALGDTTSTTYINSSCQKQAGEIPVKYASTTGETSFILTYNNQDGTGCTEQAGEYKKTWGTLCTPTKEDGVSFLGWFTQPNGGGTEVTSSSIVNGNTIVYAKWGIPPVCKRATTLHTATCNITDSNGCNATGREGNGNTITYGSLGTKGVLTSGDAFDCDVNGDGTFDSATERFYYVTKTGTGTNETATLIYYTNVENGSATTRYSYRQYSSASAATNLGYTCTIGMGCNWYGPLSAFQYLPSNLQWNNEGLILPGERQITNEMGTIINTNSGTSYQIQKFTYTDKAARFLTYQEVQAACGSNITNEGDLDNCKYLVERTYYETGHAAGIIQNDYWLENNHSSYLSSLWYVSGSKRKTSFSGMGSTFGVRPAIDVLTSNIEY